MKKILVILFIGLLFVRCGEENKNQKEYGQLIDERDTITYATIKIGNQEWMAENLAFKPSSGNYWVYNNESSNLEKYGYLYDWKTACEVCPDGWHLPSDNEWTVLIDTLGGEKVAGVKLKSTSGWQGYNGTNESGFNGLSGGRLFPANVYSNEKRYRGYWWSRSGTSFYLKNMDSTIHIYDFDKKIGMSVRCIKD